MMSSFLFGVAFERLLFNALNRYLLKNSSSIETEMRSLILPLESTLEYACYEYLSLYLGIDTLPSWSKLRKPTAISGTPQIPWPLERVSGRRQSQCFCDTVRVTRLILALTAELVVRSRDAGKTNNPTRALHGMVILVRTLPFIGNIGSG
jgi:hypothetical protein